MPDQPRSVGPGPTDRTVCTDDGSVLEVPAGWELLPPGDAGLTRRVKAAGPSWTVRERGRKNRLFSRGVWAPAANIEAARTTLSTERADPGYARRRAADATRRERKQAEYAADFEGAVRAFLDFHPTHAELGRRLARAVAEHATPVGSGTVARTQRIPIDERAAAAVIAWMRHQTTAYDHMQVARIKGERREVRRRLAARSRALLQRYRGGLPASPDCPLAAALAGDPAPAPEASWTRPRGTRGGWAQDQT